MVWCGYKVGSETDPWVPQINYQRTAIAPELAEEVVLCQDSIPLTKPIELPLLSAQEERVAGLATELMTPGN
jgi:hypothetical protein